MTALQAPPAAASGSPAPQGSGRSLPPPSRDRITLVALLAGLVGLAIWSFFTVGLSWEQIVRGVAYAQRFLARTVPFEWAPLSEILWMSALTLGIVICGTTLAAILSIPVAMLAARNTAPNRGARATGRGLTVLARALPDVILAMVFASFLGLGSPAGILALGIHSVGMIAKLTADAIEQIDEGPRMALRAAGATKSQEFWGGVWPQILPSFVATVLHRNDINLRVSVILGFVNVPGLGDELSIAIRTLDYQAAIPWAIVIFVLCVGMEIISSVVRQALLGIQPTGKGMGDRMVRRFGRSGATGLATTPVVDPRRRPWTRDRILLTSFGWAAIAAVVASVFVSSTVANTPPNFLQNLGIALQRMFPPATEWSRLPDTFEAVVETLQIALAATLIAFVFSIVIGSLGARNVAPNALVRGTSRFSLVIIRGIPELLLALFLLILTGLGPAAATIALGIGGIGLLGKLFADSLEEVNPGPERALRATGASRGQIYASATLPQGAPAIVGHSLYLFDSNFRAATILGIVGAGGIGFPLSQATRIDQQEMTFLICCIIVVVFAIEGLSSWIRRLVA